MMSDSKIRMADVFDLPVFVDSDGDIETVYGEWVTIPSHAADAVCDAINNHDRLTAENERLRDEVGRLREGDKQADFTRMNLHIEKKIQIEKLEKERDQLKATLQRFMELGQNYRDLPLELFAIQRSVSAKAMNLANHDAEVIERIASEVDRLGEGVQVVSVNSRWLRDYANKLRQ